MNHLIAKKSKNEPFVKIMSDKVIFELPDDLDNWVQFDTLYKLEDDEWFAIASFSETEFAIDMIRNKFSSSEFNQISSEDYTNLSYLCSYQDERYFYFQKLNKSQTINKKWFALSNEPELQVNNPIVIIKSIADAIYDRTKDILYFNRLSAVTGIFPNIVSLYREATQEDTEIFLSNNFIKLTNDFDASKVKIANRKRIAMATDSFATLTPKQKSSIYKYIKGYCGDLEYSDKEKCFNIGTEANLKQLLFGIDQRFYTTPIGKEKRLANSITKI